MKGKVVRIYADKGFGFIKGADGRDYFFHKSSVETPLVFDDIEPNEDVIFEESEGPKGPRAEQVTCE